MRLFDRSEMNTYRDDTAFIHLVGHHLEHALLAIFTGTDTCPQFPPAQQHEVLALIQDRYRTVIPELTARLNTMASASLSDAYLQVNEYEANCVYMLRKLVIARLLLAAIHSRGKQGSVSSPNSRVIASSSNSVMTSACCLGSAELLVPLIKLRYDHSALNVGYMLMEEITKFVSLLKPSKCSKIGLLLESRSC